MNTPQPGDFGLSTIGGFTGWWINLGQALTRDASRYTHAFIVLDDNTILEAEPGGARIAPLSKYIGKAVFSDIPLTDTQRRTIVTNARKEVGVPYSFLDYLAIALLNFGIKPKRLRNYVKSSHHMICSQLVDYVYCESDIHLFSDGRESQDVTPGDLANMLLERDWL